MFVKEEGGTDHMTIKIDLEMLEIVKESIGIPNTELLLLGGHVNVGKIVKTEKNIVHMHLNMSQPYIARTHISKVVGVNSRCGEE